MPDWVPINWDLIKHPANWAIIILMVLFFGLVLDIFLFATNPPSQGE